MILTTSAVASLYVATTSTDRGWLFWTATAIGLASASLAYLAGRHIVYTAATHLTTMTQRPFTAVDKQGLPVPPPFTPLARRRIASVRAHLTNQLGNHVFQYIYARSLAGALGVPFSSPRLGGPFKHLPTHVPAAAPSGLSQQDTGEVHSTDRAQALLARAGNVWMQDSGIYDEAQWGRIKSWLGASVDACGAQLSAAIQQGGQAGGLPELGDHDVVAHVRLGDIVSGLHASYRPLPYLFYREALQAVIHRQGGVLPKRVLLVTNEPQHAIVRRLKTALQDWLHSEHPRSAPTGDTPCVFEVYSHSMLGDFLLMRGAANLILSVSTFSWWAGILGSGFVVVPCHGNAWPSSAPPAYSANAAVGADTWQEAGDGLWTALWEDVLCGGAFRWGSDVAHVSAATSVSRSAILQARQYPPAPPSSFQVLGTPACPAAPPSTSEARRAEHEHSSSAAYLQAKCVPEGARQCLFLPPQDSHRAHYIALHLGRWGGMKHMDMLFVGAPENKD